MRTSELYEAQLRIALVEFSDFVVRGEISRLPSEEALKLRLLLSDDSFIEAHSSVTGRYSYHWERRLAGRSDIYRFDNAPHNRWKDIKTFPHHFHDGRDEQVGLSPLTDDPIDNFRQVLQFIRDKLRSESRD